MSVNLKKLVENKRTFYLFPLTKKVGDRSAFLDATDLMHDAIRADRKRGYKAEQGPAFAIEAVRARAYADYVDEHAAPENLTKFDTRRYSFYLNALTDEQVEREVQKVQ